MSLKISNISKSYNNKWVLRDVSFEVERGKIIGLFGENSSGKSSLLKIIQGLEKPNSGQISFAGNNLTDAVLVSNNFPKNWKNLFAKSVQISESERQMTTFENALNLTKTVLLMDNPISGLDRFQKEKLLEKLKKSVSENNLVIIFATNNEEEAFSFCDEIVVLSGGYVSQFAPTREIYEKPKSVAVAEVWTMQFNHFPPGNF
jgi:ABC-type sulfate/molybdate transport systems ATPase subunit